MAKHLLFLATLALSACAGFDKTPTPELSYKPHSKVFPYSYDKVWRATQIVLAKYPISASDVDKGLLKTQKIPLHTLFKPATHLPQKAYTDGRRYALEITVIKGSAKLKVPASKVVIKKKIQNKRDFFAASEKEMSDGLEEQAVLYRIGRELLIDHALEKSVQ